MGNYAPDDERAADVTAAGATVAVVVVPIVGDPGGVLAEGLLGARAPEAWWWFCPAKRSFHGWDEPVIDGGWRVPWRTEVEEGDHGPPGPGPHPHEVALPLWWSGALVPEGWDRARRVYRANMRNKGGNPSGIWFDDEVSVGQVFVYAEWMVAAGLASRVVRLALVDGRLVEVTGG